MFISLFYHMRRSYGAGVKTHPPVHFQSIGLKLLTLSGPNFRLMAENVSPPFANLSYLKENVKPPLLRDFCTLYAGALVSDSL